MTGHWSTRLLAVVLVLSQIGCGWKITPPSRPQGAAREGKIADAVVLQVNDAGVLWGGGACGEVVRERWLQQGVFSEVHYPVEPRNPPPLRLMIQATGNLDEEVGLGTLKAVVIGLLLFLPVGLIRFNKDFILDATVTVTGAGGEPRRFAVHSATTVSHTMFSDSTGYEAEARRVAFADLADQVAAQLR